MEDGIEKLKDIIKIQRDSANHSPYMQGMYNGLVLALSAFDGKSPEFLEAPEVWEKDIPAGEGVVPSEASSG